VIVGRCCPPGLASPIISSWRRGGVLFFLH